MPTLKTLTIPNAAAPSGSFTIPVGVNSHKVLILVPVAWTAADIKMQFSNDVGSTWFDVLDDAGAVIKLTSVPLTGGGLMIAPDDAGGNDYAAAVLNALPSALFRLVSINTAGGADLVQGAERVLSIINSPQAQTLFSRPSDTSAK